MGVCCSKDAKFEGLNEDNMLEEKCEGGGEGDNIQIGDCGARIMLQGSSNYTSMFTQRGRKGVNQDTMTVWEEFTGDKDTFFCGVFDGHGPSGHKVARHVRDNLPAKLSSTVKLSQHNEGDHSDADVANGKNNKDDDNTFKDAKDPDSDNNSPYPFQSLWEASIIKSYRAVDEEICSDTTIDTYCSGATAVTMVKQGDNLIIANLGDSRALLCTRHEKNQLVPVQLTVDLKPDIPSEAERITNSKGRVFAMDGEPDVLRIWMPEENCPGLAMSRAFGDFCLKDYGLTSVPEVSYRKLTDNDEFVVLATDGVWDVLTNNEVIRVVASTRKRSMAAKLLVYCAIRAWRSRFPDAKIDDCAAICLFLKKPPVQTKTGDNKDQSEFAVSYYAGSVVSDGGVESVISNITVGSKEEWSALNGVSIVNSLVNLPKHPGSFNRPKEA